MLYSIDKDANDTQKVLSKKTIDLNYPSFNYAVEARIKTKSNFSVGKRILSREAATAIVDRATIRNTDGTVKFRHDYRIKPYSAQYTIDQLRAITQDVQCAICFIQAEDGNFSDENMREVIDELVKPTIKHIFPGGHHLHCDPDTAPPVVLAVLKFLLSRYNA